MEREYARTSGANPALKRYLLERVEDVAVVQVYADGFSVLSLQEKTLAWHLYLAALAGRDIYYDQRHALNLEMRALLEAVLTHGEDVDPRVLQEIRRYTKLFWINSGPYNNLTARKFLMRLTLEELVTACDAATRAGAQFPCRGSETLHQFVTRLAPMFFDAAVDPSVTNKTPGRDRDILESSANNLYVGVSMADLSGFEERYGLNSRLVKRDGVLVEEVYRAGGRYDASIRRIIGHLQDALPYATVAMAEALRALIQFYQTGEESDRIAYDRAWVRDNESLVDTINGFIEVYLDPRGVKGAWEGLVFSVNQELTRRIQTLAANARWFEDNLPCDPRYRKTEVLGISARVMDVIIETGDSGPITPVGINLPNDQVIREQDGSKSVTLANVSEAYEQSTPEALKREFSWSDEEVARAVRWAALAHELTTELHEVIGHGSGRMADGIVPHVVLKEQYSSLEEARADLVALYFLADPKLVALGLMAAADHDTIVQANYEYYTRNALVQLRRVREGTQIEEDHMRNRQMIVHWLMAHTTAIDVRRRDGKTYYVMVDARAFREGAGRLLGEVQRIKSEGDYPAAKALFESYGVHFDAALRDEIVARVDALDLPSYTAFVMPRLDARHDGTGEIVDIEISYPCDLEQQMLEYSRAATVTTPAAAR
jgi:dipeptidyl-peptidase-3